MSRNLYERLSSRHLPVMSEADDGAPSGGTTDGRPPATDDSSQVRPPATGDNSQARPPATGPTAALTPPALSPAPIAPTGGGGTDALQRVSTSPPAVPATAQRDSSYPNGSSPTDSRYSVEPVAHVASEPNTAQVFTEAEVNNRLAQQRAQFDRQIQNLKLQNAAIATGIQGADVLLERIDRKAITYDDAGKPSNLADLLKAQRDAMAQALGLAPATPAPAPAAAPAAPAIPQIPPTNGAGAPGGPALEEANLFAEGLFRK